MSDDSNTKPVSNEVNLEQQIEAVLFYKAKPVAISWLLKFFESDAESLGNALVSLQQALEKRGLRLLVSDNKEVQLVTAPEFSQLIEKIRRDDLKRDSGTAGAETLAVIMYRGPISRVEIDRIRGVNSAFILRNLQIRGLIERSGTDNARGYSYQTTPALLAHLGVEQKEALPDYATVAAALDSFAAEQPEAEEVSN